MSESRKNDRFPGLSATELEERANNGEKFKNLGNDLFRQGKYKEAAEMYNSAVDVDGTQPVYMSNLAATYLKLEDYEMAQKAASMALIHDPRMAKARFRRGLARKETNQLRAAMTDFGTILKEDPNCAEAKTELAVVERLIEINGYDDDSGLWDDWEYPAPDHPPRDVYPLYLLTGTESNSSPESEKERLGHVGNGIPCKHHNLKPLGCAKGESCVYSHAPDARSIPDTEGRNVCLYFLLGSCKFGDRCLYSHSKANLPDLWDDETRIPEVRELIKFNEEAIRERRLFTNYMGKGPFASDTLLAVKRAVDDAVAREAVGEFVDFVDSTPFIIHLTLNKSSDIPRDTVSGMREILEVSRAKSKKKTLSLLSSPVVLGVFITDAGIIQDKNKDLLAKIVAYAKGGGVVVIGGSFKTFEGNRQADVTPAQLEAFFQKGWGLPWKMGSHRATDRKTFTLNPNRYLHAPVALPDTLSMKALHLKGVRADAALYLSTGHSQLDSSSFRPCTLVETPIAFTKFGEGLLAFVGDVGAEKATTDLIIAMFGFSPSS